MRTVKTLYVLWIGILLASFCGCAGSQPNIGDAVPGDIASLQTARDDSAEYRLQVGDELSIKLYYNSELNEEVKIRPDGMISLQFVGETRAAGRTPRELSAFLKEQYAQNFQRSEVTVIVRDYGVKKVYVGGEVPKPGIIEYTGSLTALQAVIQAGGFLNTAELENIVLIRKGDEGTPQMYLLDLAEVLTGIRPIGDIPVEPYDVVFVPKTAIARMNQFVEQYIEKLIPVSMNFGFSFIYDLNNDEILVGE